MRLTTELRNAFEFTAGRAFLWGLGKSGDLGAQILQSKPLADPYPHYEQVRAHGVLCPSRIGMRLTASHALTNSVLRDPRFGVVPADEYSGVDWTVGGDPSTLAHPVESSLLSLDPPAHTRLRRIAAPWFTPAAVRRRTDRIEQVVREHLDELAEVPRFDLMRDYACRVPVRVICDLFGIEHTDQARMMRWGTVLGGTLDGIRSVREQRAVLRTVGDMGEFFDQLIARRRRDPGEDVLSGLLAARPDGAELTRHELVATAGLLLGAGFETTVNLIGNGVLALLSHPDARQLLIEQPERAADVTEEVLRFDSPVQFTVRAALEPLHIAGVDLPRRGAIAMLLGGTNRDPEVFDHPQRFDPDRSNNREHLSFSSGIHYCLGSGLARVEGEIALRELFARFPDLRQAGPAERKPTRIIRGVRTLPVDVRARHFSPT